MWVVKDQFCLVWSYEKSRNNEWLKSFQKQLNFLMLSMIELLTFETLLTGNGKDKRFGQFVDQEGVTSFNPQLTYNDLGIQEEE